MLHGSLSMDTSDQLVFPRPKSAEKFPPSLPDDLASVRAARQEKRQKRATEKKRQKLTRDSSRMKPLES